MVIVNLKKKIILLIGIVLVIVILGSVWKKNQEFRDYVYVKDENDVIFKLNRDFFLSNQSALTFEEYVKELSSSLTMAYFYLDSIDSGNVIFIDNLTDEQIAWLTYYVISAGSDAVCIDKNFFEEIAEKYFGRDEFQYRETIDGLKYRSILGRYCFEHHFFDYISRFELKNYNVSDDAIILSYEEIFDEDNDINNRKWGIQFRRGEEGYHLVSVYSSY